MAEEAELILENPEEEEEQGERQGDMELECETPSVISESAKSEENGAGKRPREGNASTEEDVSDVVVSKKQKVDEEKSVEEKRLEKLEDKEIGEEKKEEENDKEQEPVKLGPKTFSSSTVMFDYFYKLIHTWSPHIDLNKYEHMVLLDLLKKGHPEPEKKIGDGVQAFQIRNHPLWKNKCFFILRVDGSYEDFSFRKCVHNIMPLPDNMIAVEKHKPANGNRNGGFHHGGRGGRGGGKGGRGGRGRR